MNLGTLTALTYLYLQIRERVRFTYTGVDCVTSFSETAFDITNDNDHSDVS